MGADSLGMEYDPAWRAGPSRGPSPEVILGMTFGEGLNSSRLDQRQAVSPGVWENMKGDVALQGAITCPSPMVRLSPSLRSSRAA